MTKWSSNKKDKLIFEGWRRFLNEDADRFEAVFGEHETDGYYNDLAQAIVSQYENDGMHPDLEFDSEVEILRQNPRLLDQDPWAAGAQVYKILKHHIANARHGKA